jgi:biotin--protein ligase
MVFTAAQQVKGTGRGNNVWVSPEGCLMFSVQVVHRNYATLVHAQYIMALSIVDAVRSRPEYKDIDLRIKWPNDIYWNKTKVAGVLVNSNYFENRFTLVIGKLFYH